MPKCRKRHVQIELDYKRHGGRRKGAGRRPSGRRRVSHTRRPELNPRHPRHITLRFLDGLPTLRRRDVFRLVRRAMHQTLAKANFRIVHLSIQSNHVHMVCEASSRVALTRGIQGFKISVAKKLNQTLGRSGRVFADRYHEEVLTTPTQVRNAVAYCLNNWRKHREDRGATTRVDPFSTAIWFPGWLEPTPKEIVIPPGIEVLPSSRPQTWLLAEGWRRTKPISLYEVPGPRN